MIIAKEILKESNMTSACGSRNIEDAKTEINSGNKFDWDEMTQGLVLSSFSWGYIATQFIGGRMAENFGTKKVYGICMFLSGILSFISPWVTKWHFHAFMVLRAIQGALHGVTWPSLHVLTARWVSVEERGSFIARTYFGSVFGTILTFPMCGAIIQASGWEMAFHICGIITAVWFVCWWLLVFDFPDQHPRISNNELSQLQTAIGENVEKLPIPWKRILLSMPFWSLIIADFTPTYGLVTLLMYFPTYLKLMLGFNIAKTGFISSLPMLCRYIGGLLLSYLADWFIAKGKLSVTNVRKTFQSLSQVMTALAMGLTAFSGCNPVYPIMLQCIGFFCNGALASGCLASYIDLSPNFSGTLFGIGNTFAGGGAAFSVPLIVGSITQDNMTFTAWRTVFLLATGITIFGNAIYCMFITADVQEWNYGPKSKHDLHDNKDDVSDDQNITLQSLSATGSKILT